MSAGEHSTSDLLAAASAEIARLNGCLRWEQHRAGRQGTHAPGCWAFGPAHFECAISRIVKLSAENIALKSAARIADRDLNDAYAEGRADEAEAAEQSTAHDVAQAGRFTP